VRGESANQVAGRMRAAATAMSDPADAKAILRYADWLDAKAESKLGRRRAKCSSMRLTAQRTLTRGLLLSRRLDAVSRFSD
jgi:cytochrome c